MKLKLFHWKSFCSLCKQLTSNLNKQVCITKQKSSKKTINLLFKSYILTFYLNGKQWFLNKAIIGQHLVELNIFVNGFTMFMLNTVVYVWNDKITL